MKQPRLPRTVLIGKKRIPVRRQSLPRDTWGFTYLNVADPEIHVSRRLRSALSLLTTAWHEYLHHLFPTLHERQILSLERALIRAFRDNPTFFRNLIDSARGVGVSRRPH